MFDLAIWYRSVGGFMGLGSTFWARMRWSLIMALYMAFATLVHHQAPLQIAAVFVTVTIGTYLGRMIPHDFFQAKASVLNSLGMAVVNIARLALIVLPYAVMNWVYILHNPAVIWQSPSFIILDLWRLYLVGFGVMAGLAYFVGNLYLHGKDVGIYYRNTHEQTTTGDFIPAPPAINCLDHAAWGGSEWGELLTGELVYELMFLTALVLP